ncbi:MAG TPA: ATP-binding cassette domain-containing protein [Actinopolymorphaceae bacterium]|nr:ATP-binding cassette domain-containing protein [Actinopolymorphaceae bacterium]
MIELDDLRKTSHRDDGDVVVLSGVDLYVDTGGIYGVVGTPADGTTMLLRCVNLLDRPDEGTVRVDGLDLTLARPSQLRVARHAIGMIGSPVGLLEQRSVSRNVAMPLAFAGIRVRQRDLYVDEILDQVGLADRADAYPADLDPEEVARTAVARALVSCPRVLLCDEPTAGLEPAAAEAILVLLRDLATSLGVTVLLATRDYDVVKAVCDSVALLRAGRIVDHGRVTDLLDRSDSELAGGLLPGLPAATPQTVGATLQADLTFLGNRAHGPVLTETARAYGVDLTVVAGSIQTICGLSVGRLRVELTGPGEDCQRALLRFADLNLTPKVLI